jgi:cyclophilin family peptidyl-prolyl cis-trans isomerase
VGLAPKQGTIGQELKIAEAPGVVASFALLARKHFGDGPYFHRVVSNFVAQGGGRRGDGSGTKS